jgi:hypothetical protein
VATEIVWLDVNVHDINTSSKHSPGEERKQPEIVGEVIKCRALKIRKYLYERTENVLANEKGESRDCNVVLRSIGL